MDKKKRMRGQQVSISSSRGSAPGKAVTKGRSGNAPAKAYKPYKKIAARPSRGSRNFIEDEDMQIGRIESEQNVEASASATPNTGASLLGGFGGIDGIISMMGKANQMIRLFQQMGPIMKLFGMFGGGAKVSTASVRLNRKNRSSYKSGSKPGSRSVANRATIKSRSKR
ncbi:MULTISPECIES: hypothetical protein [unclassified Paenibacillus]|uniref:hypothetical protein n=1 Tax=unclassified Paenibacillus TaxID=185978 RepID=UPI0036353A60